MIPDFTNLDDNELIALSNKVVAEFESICKFANDEERLRERVMSLRQAVDPGETFDRLRDDDAETARDLLRLGASAMTSSRVILLTQKELMRRGLIATPNDF